MYSGLVEPVMDTEQHLLHYPDVHALMRELKRAGAQNAVNSRARGLTGRGRLRRMRDAYEENRTAAGLPATFEVIFGAAFAGVRGQADQLHSGGEVAIPLSSLKKHVR
jgi:malonyl-CoA O-methyltransferase